MRVMTRLYVVVCILSGKFLYFIMMDVNIHSSDLFRTLYIDCGYCYFVVECQSIMSNE